jgi:hypothetical protein
MRTLKNVLAKEWPRAVVEIHRMGRGVAGGRETRGCKAPGFRRAASTPAASSTGQVADHSGSGRLRQGILRRRQAAGSDLSWTLDGDRDGVYSRPTHHVIASLKTDIEDAGAGSNSQDEASARLTDHAGRTQIYHALGVACPAPRPAFSAASWARADQSRSP